MSLEDLGILLLPSSYSYLGGGLISLDDDAETEAGTEKEDEDEERLQSIVM